MQHSQSLVSMRAVRPLIHAVAASGVPRERFLREAQLGPDCEREADARLPRAKLFQLFELALELTGDPAFGLHSIERLTSEALSPLGAIVMHAATLQDALRSLQEFRGLFGDEASFQIQEQNGEVSVRCLRLPEITLATRRYLSEVSLGGLYLFLRRFVSSPADCVMFDYAAPDYATEYARVFEGRARFEQPFTGLRFDAERLTAPAPHVDPDLHDALRAYARRRVRHLTVSQSWADRVHELLVWQTPPRDMSMRGAARRLAVSTRTLRRHLQAEQTCYADVVTRALATLAKHCLLDEHRTIMETAYELGFSDNTAFHRAFKRWTGQTPTEYRRSHGLGPASARRA